MVQNRSNGGNRLFLCYNLCRFTQVLQSIRRMAKYICNSNTAKEDTGTFEERF